ncbi:DUF3238 domain-containing protein [Sporosarcina sp. PTS2304]|uniref:DUF3238 domain-containing protein n=1 Tax=Sporosarcina sp. PTS2304 TaxID=2283194 RepID=UPI000E0D125C|nr:DUF3238 domain-containing protein [Sporosarcina sp. PTS2304]AXI00451.1 DUF3238 domain-containing protein [Sporosarcina sp. PTS2304]
MENLFEIQKMSHTLDELSFTWTDSGGIYRVYRNEQQVYEGTVAKFTDDTLDTEHPFTYTVERVEEGQVKDVIVIQTSALTEVREDEHPLQRLVITTIAASSQIALSWERIKGVEAFDIYRNGKFVQTVEDNRFIDRETSVSESVTYSVSASRPLIDSNQQMNVSKSIAATIFDAVVPTSSDSKPTEEIYTFTIRVNRRDELLRPVADRKRATSVKEWKFRYTTFLQEDILKNPNLLSPYAYFTGDDRTFDPEGKSFRTRVDMQGKFTENESTLTYTKATGPTIGLNYVKRYKDHDHASVDDIVIERLNEKKSDIHFAILHDVANPLTTSPPIHYEVTGQIDKERNINLVGYHNISPHHEIYLALDEEEWRTVHRAESEGLAYLSGVPGDNYWRYMTCN